MWTCWNSEVMEITEDGQLVVNYSCPERPDMVIGVLISLPADITLATTEWVDEQIEIQSINATRHWDLADDREARKAEHSAILATFKGKKKMVMRPEKPKIIQEAEENGEDVPTNS